MTSPSTPTVEYSQEIRFAIVMYGGISLAIYINGVAQELLHLVRATAPANHPDTDGQNLAKYADSELTGSEKVYRKLGQMLVRGKDPLDLSVTSPKQEGGNQAIGQEPAAIRTRFVVDILSGSSAGGINAVFLAKALANDQPLRDLESLWVEEGEMAVLINDRDSLSKTNLKVQDPPKSLLNSRRMYWQLLDALDGMEAVTRSSVTGSTNMEELDLFVTATDMAGQIIKLQLADRTVQERRHRKVFHFVFSAGNGQTLNDFIAANNPFLAFAARATSAHPAAFEPMTLGGIDQILQRHDKYSEKSDVRAVNPGWHKFYDEYLRAGDGKGPLNLSDQALQKLSAEFAKRPFNDGGVLDNQPFSHTLDTLGKHHSNFPTVRKLLYIEPAPEHTKADPDQPTPDFAANAWLSLSTLPRYEPIREHLQRVLDRNRLIERVENITEGMEEDIKVARKEGVTLKPLTIQEFRNANLADMIDRNGFGWASYQRLRVAETTDELVRLVCRTLGFDEDSDHFTTVRQVIRGWRDGRYLPNVRPEEQPSDDSQKKLTQTAFLMDFDLLWRLRRLRFLMSKIDALACFDAPGKRTFEKAVDEAALGGFSYPTNPPEDVAKPLRSTLLQIKSAVNHAYRTLRGNRQALWSSPIGAPDIQDKELAAQVDAVRDCVSKIDLNKFFSSGMEDLSGEGRERAALVINRPNSQQGANFVKYLGMLVPVLDEWFRTTRRIVENALTANVDAPIHEKVFKGALKFYFDHFDRYDMVSHPILYATNAGDELDRVEVFRVSPEDATNIVDEADEGKKKLFGTKLGNFGAFFKRDFRTNDILWGRLDGAERIITALLPDAKYDRKRTPTKHDETRDRLIEEAQNAILKEVLGVEDESKLTAILKELAAGTKPADIGGKPKQDTEHAFGIAGAENLASYLTEPRVRFALTSFLKNQTPIQVFRQSFLENYEGLREFNNQDMVKNAARASKVFGRMLEGYADDHKINNKRVTWVTRAAQLFWGLVEVAIPGSIGNLIFQHWLKLIYLFEFLLILLGTLLTSPAAQQFGWLTFGITVTVHTAQLILGDALTGKHWLRRFLVALGMLLILSLTVLGIFTFVAMFYAPSLWRVLQKIEAWQSNPTAAGRTFLKVLLVSFVGAFLLRTLWRGLSERIHAKWLALLPLVLGAAITGGMIYGFYIAAHRQQTLPGGLHMPALAIEMARNPAEVLEIKKYASPSGTDESSGAQKLRTGVNLDFGFIALYTAVFLTFSYWLSRRRVGYPALAIVTTVLAVTTAGLDVLENFRLYAVLSTSIVDLGMVQRLHVAGLLKWIFCFETTALLSLLFLSRKDFGYLFGLGLMLVSIVGVIGVFYHRLLEFAFLGLGVLLVLIGLFVIIAPGRFLSRNH